jgi:hypothetical protein
MSPLAAWATFYVIVGTAAAVLTGLIFVVITLIVQTRLPVNTGGIAAYTTPTVVSFGVALFLAALLSAPWTTLIPPALVLGLCGLAGTLYSATVVQRQRRVEGYTPVLEDWVWYGASPLVAYLALVAAAPLLPVSPEPTLLLIGAAMALLLFNGIRNAWDIVTYIVVERVSRQDERQVGNGRGKHLSARDASITTHVVPEVACHNGIEAA